MFEATEIERLIAAGLECDFLQIEGDDGTHFTGIVVSPAFEGKRRVQQHQAVYATLGKLMATRSTPSSSTPTRPPSGPNSSRNWAEGPLIHG